MSRREPGYRPDPKLYRMVFDDHQGLIVRARSSSADILLKITELAELAGADATLEDAIKDMLGLFSQVLVSWNLERSETGPLDAAGVPVWELGDPVPTTREGLMSIDFELAMTMVEGWLDAVAGVSAPLASPSSNGLPSLVESLPMEPLSENRAS